MKWCTKKAKRSYEARKAQAIAQLSEAEMQVQSREQTELDKLAGLKQALDIELQRATLEGMTKARAKLNKA